MTVRLARLSYGLALGALVVGGTRFLYSATLYTWPQWTRTLFAWAVLVGAMAAVAFLAYAVGILKGRTLDEAIAHDQHHILFQTFVGLTLGFWFLSIGVYAYADPTPPSNVDAWRVFVLFIGSLFVAGGTRHPRWLYERLRHSGGNELLADTQLTQAIFIALGGMLSIYALATRGTP